MNFERTRTVKLPIRSTKSSAGLDFFTPTDMEPIEVRPGESVNIPSGIRMDIPDDTVLIAFNKSGVALKGLFVGAQVVDSDYTGEIHLHVFNPTKNTIVIEPGKKLVQFLHLPIFLTTLTEVMSIDKQTERGSGGFGSTGLE
jgi:dUTP pyrophosphatase